MIKLLRWDEIKAMLQIAYNTCAKHNYSTDYEIRWSLRLITLASSKQSSTPYRFCYVTIYKKVVNTNYHELGGIVCCVCVVI